MRSISARAFSLVVTIALTLTALVGVAGHARAAPVSVVTHTVPVGTSPRAIAITPDGRTAIVANSGSTTVSIIDVVTGVVTSTVTVGTDPTDIKISPDGATAYVAVGGTFGVPSSAALHWLDIANASITRTLQTTGGGLGAFPTSVIVSPDGLWLYVWSGALGIWLAKVRASDGAVFTPVYSYSGSSIRSVALSADGRRIAISPVVSSANVDIIDTDTMNLVQAIPVGTGQGHLAYSVDGNELYLSDSSANDVAVIDTSSYNVTRWSSGGNGPEGLVTAHSGTVFVSNQTGNSVAALRSGAVLGAVNVSSPQVPVLTEEQDRVLVPSASANALAIINTTSLSRELVTVGSSPAEVATARGYAVVSNNGSNSVSIIRLAQTPASGDQVPTAPLQQFGRAESDACSAAIPDSVLFPGVGEDQRRDGWGMSWAQWPNAGTGGFVCTRQPYFTNAGTWSVG